MIIYHFCVYLTRFINIRKTGQNLPIQKGLDLTEEHFETRRSSMSGLLRPNWFHYALTGVIAVMASWALTGCRFGNHEESQAQTTDGITGYYETQPQTMKYCASVPNESCQDVATNQIPQDFLDI